MASEVRLIDANSLMKTVQANDYMLCSLTNSTDRGMFTSGIQQAVDEQPTIDPESLRAKGRWELVTTKYLAAQYGRVGYCTNCNEERLVDKYCPNCGAKMEG